MSKELIVPKKSTLQVAGQGPDAPVHANQQQQQQQQQRYFSVTNMGAAVYFSALPLQQGIVLYRRLEKARDMFVLSSPLHAIFLCLLEQPLEIFSWPVWGKVYEGLPEAAKRVGGVEGITPSYIQKRLASHKGNQVRGVL